MQSFKDKLIGKEIYLLVGAIIFASGLVVFALNILQIPDTHALNTCGSGYQITNSAKVVSCHGVCRVVSVSGTWIFVGTSTSGEWSAFRSNPPPGSSIGGCVSPPPPPPPPSGADGTRKRCECWANLFGTICTSPWLCLSTQTLNCSSWCNSNCLGHDGSTQVTQCTTACDNSGC